MEILETKVRINGIELTFLRQEEIPGAVAVETDECGREEFAMDDTDEITFVAAKAVALGVYGQRRNGNPNCSNSDVHEIWNLMKQVAGM